VDHGRTGRGHEDRPDLRSHDGAPDRLDAVMFTVVVGYYMWLALL
jgi:hypothetical protein